MVAQDITQEDLDRLRWYHQFNLPGGLHTKRFQTSDASFQRILEAFISAELTKISFRSKTVLDVGCWDGLYSFMAEEAGAETVTAVDDFSQNWGSPEGFRIIKQLKQSSVAFHPDLSVYDLNAKLHGKTYDIVLFMGVYYHLHTPYLAFANLRALCHAATTVIIEGDCIRDDQDAYAQMNLHDPDRYKFVPSTRLLDEMLHSCYFQVESKCFMNDYRPNQAPRTVNPGDFLELVSRLRSLESDSTLASRDRVFLVCRPVELANKVHRYPAPFGLAVYDQRTENRSATGDD